MNIIHWWVNGKYYLAKVYGCLLITFGMILILVLASPLRYFLEAPGSEIFFIALLFIMMGGIFFGESKVNVLAQLFVSIVFIVEIFSIFFAQSATSCENNTVEIFLWPIITFTLILNFIKGCYNYRKLKLI